MKLRRGKQREVSFGSQEECALQEQEECALQEQESCSQSSITSNSLRLVLVISPCRRVKHASRLPTPTRLA